MANQFHKYTLLMWRNYITLLRHPIQAVCEIICPVIVCLIVVGVRVLIDEKDEKAVNHPPFPAIKAKLCDHSSQFIAYSPRSPLVKTTISNMCPNIPLLEYENSSVLNSQIDDNRNVTDKFAAALVFSENLKGINSTSHLPASIDLTIRLPSVLEADHEEWFTDHLYPQLQTSGPREYNSSDGGKPYYLTRGFLYLQQATTFGLLNDGNITPPIDIKLNRFPYPKWKSDYFYIIAQPILMPLMVMLSFMKNSLFLIRDIVTEKEKQLKESMKVMGLPGWLNWISWFSRSFMLFFIAIILIVVLFIVMKKPVLKHSEWSVVLILLTMYACSVITFSFFISGFFSKATGATVVGGLIFFFSFIPYSVSVTATKNSLAKALGSSLLPNPALCFGIFVIVKFEAIEEGAQWKNLFIAPSPDEKLTMGAVFLMLLFDIFWYLIAALYIEAVFPGEFGIAQPWYFPFTRRYWCNKPEILDGDIALQDNAEYLEEVTESLPIGIQLKNLSKTFGVNKAVRKLNLEVYEGQITVLLGHNSAGKTTTMFMITGMFPPTSGTAVVNGYDVRRNVQKVRDSMGLCLQHNVLFDNLTVWEHLYFFGKLKGLRNNQIKTEIDNFIRLLELEDKRDVRSKTLSGGMKRRLCLGIALCGNSKVVILDEPTAGVDPSARRVIWNLLQQQKHGKTILLTTHHMDEADLLGDRIAIMTRGELRCCGSGFFLKKKYGTGYYLIMDVVPQCQPKKITSFLRKFVADLEIHSYVGSELTYMLPERESRKFEDMFGHLEQSTTSLGVQSYGVSLATLEEVFLKVGADRDSDISRKFNEDGDQNMSNKIRTTGESAEDKDKTVTGYHLITNQVLAMVLKKFLSVLRSWLLLIIQILLPIAFILYHVYNARSTHIPPSTFPSLKINLDLYPQPITLIENHNNTHTTIYSDMLKNHQVVKVDNIAGELLKQTENFPSSVKRHYIVAASFDKHRASAWFNGDPYHSPPLALGLVLNTLYKAKSNKSINFYNHPLPLTMDFQLKILQVDVLGVAIGMGVGFGLICAASLFILFYIKERVSNAKHLQFVSGVNVYVFWGVAFLCDLFIYLVIMCGALITIAALQEVGFSSADELGRVALVLVYYGFFALPFIYLCSHMFSVPSTGVTAMMLTGILVGIIFGLFIVQTMKVVNKPLSEACHYLLLFLPFYTLVKGIYDLCNIYNLRNICSAVGNLELACTLESACCGIDNYYSMGAPGIGLYITIAFSMSFLILVLLILKDHGLCDSFVKRLVKKPPVQKETIEPDVEEENKKIRNIPEDELSKTYSLALRDVTKYYKKYPAVNGLCLGVKPYECFGLLGLNGAGKTTTFKLMTGEEQISYGDIWVNGVNIKMAQKQVQKLIGYCPQFDALLDNLTMRETLNIFALIRGVSRDNCRSLGDELAHQLDFHKHLDKQVRQLSGGNKRKLSTAVALIGDPPILYLDEPTTGMDPVTRRFFWNTLIKLRDGGKCIILTSQSMEECQALCTRLAIMVNGNFQCLGSIQRLKNKFARGYVLTIKVKKIDEANLNRAITAIEDFVQTKFPGAQLKEQHGSMLFYELTDTSLSWAKMFGLLERNKSQLNIDDYSLGQCSLEQVFLNLTKHQV